MADEQFMRRPNLQPQQEEPQRGAGPRRFFKTIAGPGVTAYPADGGSPLPGYIDVYYAKFIKYVTFEDTVGRQVIDYEETDQTTYLGNLEPRVYIPEGSICLGFRENGKWFTIDPLLQCILQQTRTATTFSIACPVTLNIVSACAGFSFSPQAPTPSCDLPSLAGDWYLDSGTYSVPVIVGPVGGGYPAVSSLLKLPLSTPFTIPGGALVTTMQLKFRAFAITQTAACGHAVVYPMLSSNDGTTWGETLGGVGLGVAVSGSGTFTEYTSTISSLSSAASRANLLDAIGIETTGLIAIDPDSIELIVTYDICAEACVACSNLTTASQWTLSISDRVAGFNRTWILASAKIESERRTFYDSIWGVGWWAGGCQWWAEYFDGTRYFTVRLSRQASGDVTVTLEGYTPDGGPSDSCGGVHYYGSYALPLVDFECLGPNVFTWQHDEGCTPAGTTPAPQPDYDPLTLTLLTL